MNKTTKLILKVISYIVAAILGAYGGEDAISAVSSLF